VPIDEGDPQRLVYTSLDLGALDTFTNIAELPQGAVLSVYDRTGVLLRSSEVEEESLVGTSFADDPVVQRMISDPSGAQLSQIDDPDFIYSGDWIRIRGSDDGLQNAAFITVSLPTDVTVARADESFEENLSRLGLAALIAVAAAWVGADLFMTRDGESRKALVLNAYRVFETGDLAQLDDIFAVDVEDRTPAPGQASGLSGYKQVVAQFRAAFPNGTIEPDELLADNDKVVARVTLRGRHIADFFGSPPSGENVVANGIETFRFANGVIVEMWSMFGPLSIVEYPPRVELPEQPEPRARKPPLWRRTLGRVIGRSHK
jgi:predicted ester cyclase